LSTPLPIAPFRLRTFEQLGFRRAKIETVDEAINRPDRVGITVLTSDADEPAKQEYGISAGRLPLIVVNPARLLCCHGDMQSAPP
jgi:hypothetical protein